MAHLVTGKKGTAHVKSADVGEFNAGLHGGGIYRLRGMALSMSGLALTVGAGSMMAEGRHVRFESAESVTIDGGTSGKKRIDIVAVQYAMGEDGTESATLCVIRGTETTGTPTAPSIGIGSVLDGSVRANWPIARIAFDGTSVTVTDLLGVVEGVVEFGTNANGWHWRKWASGIGECWMRIKCENKAILDSWGGIYNSSAINVPKLPFTFSEVQLANAYIDNDYAFAIGGNVNEGSDYVYPAYACAGTYYDSKTFHVNLRYVGIISE